MQISFRQLFALLTIGFVALLVATALQAWTGPTATAPGGNIDTPINVGTSDQVKNAGLSLNALTVFGSQYVESRLGVNQASPVVALDVNGSMKLGYGGEDCTTALAGAIRYSSGVPQYCDGTAWKSFGGGSSASSTQAYATPGTYTFTAPSSFSSMTVLVSGAGGGGGSGANGPRGGGAGPSGSAGGASSFGGVTATGGGGGGGGGCHARSSYGTGSGGDINNTGRGGSGGIGSANSMCFNGYASGGDGGDGGFAVKFYTPAALSPGSSVTVTVGAAGTTHGSAAQNGSVYVEWQ